MPKSGLTGSFTFPSMWQFIQETKKQLLEQPEIPDYAAADEKQLIYKVMEALQKDCYKGRTLFYEIIKQRREYFDEKIRPVSYGENRKL